MKPNTESSASLPFGKYGEIRLVRTRENRDEEGGNAKTVVSFSAKGLPFKGENFDILQTNLCTLYGFQNVIVEPDDEDVAINIAFDCEVEGRVRNPKGLIRFMRKRLQYAMGQSYRCLHCLDREPYTCPYCLKRKEEEKAGDYRDLQAELDRRREEFEEAMGFWDEEEEVREYCDRCGEPWNECNCDPNDDPDIDLDVCLDCGKPWYECTCELDDCEYDE